jgi:putative colanic acid biosynthesis acetyltransferase WcaF
MQVDLSLYDNSSYSPGRPRWVQALWFFVGLPILRASWIPSSALRRALLRAFGSRIGGGVVIKPGVRVKYPWLLEMGSHCWIGEDAWIDNLASVQLGDHVVLSQGAYLCTGNHDWNDPAFGLIVRPIRIHNYAWVGAKALVCPGIEIATGAIAAAGSVVTQNLDPYVIYAGNPAKPVKTRVIQARVTASADA